MGWLKWASNLACNPRDLIDFGTWWSATPETWENISHIVKNVALNSYTSSPCFISITTTSKPWIAGTEAHVSMSLYDCSLKTTKIRIQSFVLTILLSLPVSTVLPSITHKIFYTWMKKTGAPADIPQGQNEQPCSQLLQNSHYWNFDASLIQCSWTHAHTLTA